MPLVFAIGCRLTTNNASHNKKIQIMKKKKTLGDPQ